ncbi:efflux RND transporter periplasmic adaptor subunit [Clostridium sp.]|uniref:efflux RND transporter periplasmic adaptor subunit n=1 Tax=Clostridium sp. TaxID=1506 RepID=UPI003F31C975
MKLKRKINFKKIVNYEFNEKVISQTKSVRILVYFFSLMIMFTVLSRFSDSLTIPRVEVTKGIQGSIDSQITLEGQIVQSKEEHINVYPELIVESVDVSEGENIKSGDLLLTLNVEDINDKVSEVKKEISEINKNTSRASEDYNIALNAENKNIESAKQAMNSAKSALDNCNNEEEKKLLEEDYNQKKSAYETLVNGKEATLLASKRALEDSKNEDEKSKLNVKLSKLQAIQNNKGKITSSKDGIVTSVHITSGDMTSKSAAISIADESEGNQFIAQMPKTSEKEVSVGQDVILNSLSSRNSIEELKVDAIKENKSNPETLDVIVKLPKGKGKIGEYASLAIFKESKNYSVCVPLEALHIEKNEYFVLVMNKKDTVLGSEDVAMKISVEIEEKNSEYVGIKDGALSTSDEIITSSNKSIKSGDRVRKESK